jgi:hypothetical protein
MCVTAIVLAAASLAVAAGGTAMSIKSASDNNAAQQSMLQMQRQQAMEDLQNKRLQAQQAEVARLGDYRQQRAANLVAIAGSGVGENISFLQGIAPADDHALALDLRNIRMGMLGEENRVAADIRVNRLNSSVSNYNKNMAIGKSVISLAGAAVNSYSFASNYGVPDNSLEANFDRTFAKSPSLIGS